LWNRYSKSYLSFSALQGYAAGELGDRLTIKQGLKCHTFDWFLENVWPELFVYDQNVTASGGVAVSTCTNVHLNFTIL